MEKLPNAKEKSNEKFDFESDEIRSQTINEEFTKLHTNIEQKFQELKGELEKINLISEKAPFTSKQIRFFLKKSNEKLQETFTDLIKELKIKGNSIPLADKVLNVDYKHLKSVKKINTNNPITSVIEYIESESLIVFGGPGKILVLDSFSLEKVTEIPLAVGKLPVLFQYEPIKEILFICCMNMTYVEAYKYEKINKKFEKLYELNNHSLPGVASLKLFDNYLLTGGYDKKLTIWNTDNKKVVKDIIFEEYLVCFEQISSSILLIGGSLSIIVFNIAENNVISSYKTHNGPIWQLIYSALYQLVISGSCDGTVKVSSYKDDGMQILHTFIQSNYSYGVCFIDQEHIITCGKDKFLRVYNVVEGKKVWEDNTKLEWDGDWIAGDPKGKRMFLSETNGIVHIFEEKI